MDYRKKLILNELRSTRVLSLPELVVRAKIDNKMGINRLKQLVKDGYLDVKGPDEELTGITDIFEVEGQDLKGLYQKLASNSKENKTLVEFTPHKALRQSRYEKFLRRQRRYWSDD